MMLKRVVPLLMIFAVAATSANSQSSPGRGHGGRGRPSPGGSPSPGAAPTRAAKPPRPTNQIVIVGVVKAIDADARRVTIAYEAVDELIWPSGTMPFAVYKAD